MRLSKQLTELEKQFYGSSMAYDKAMQQSSEPLEKVGDWKAVGVGWNVESGQFRCCTSAW